MFEILFCIMKTVNDFCLFLIFTDQAHNVTIHNKEKSLRAGSQHEFVCEALGSRPPAIITWWFDDKQIQADEDKVQVVSTSFFYLPLVICFQISCIVIT